jgi:hypothetical protein
MKLAQHCDIDITHEGFSGSIEKNRRECAAEAARGE